MTKRYLRRNDLCGASWNALDRMPADAFITENPTIEVDLDDQIAVNASLDEQHQHAERMATKWLARYQDLSAEVGRVPGTCETVDERRQMRAVIEAMRPIVEAALARGLDRKESYQDYSEWVSDVTAAVSANRDRIGAAMSAWENSQTISEDEAASAIAKAAIAWVDASDGDRGTARQLVDAIRANRSALTANAGRQR